MNPDNRFDELESLLFDWEDGTLDDAGIARVREILKADAAARTHYVQLQMINAALRHENDAGLVPLPTAMMESAPVVGADWTQLKPWRPRRWMLAVAALIICIQAVRLLQLELVKQPDTPGGRTAGVDNHHEATEATSQGVALVTRLVDAVWDEAQPPLDVGDALPPGRLALASGYAQIEFFCGATVILEGPAELDLRSSSVARVRSGRLRAQVPPAARGFSLEVDDLRVVDLGTEFGLSVSSAGANVQVFDGEVELQQPSSARRLLIAGQALVRTPNGNYETSAMTPESFLDIESLESRVQGQRDERYSRWKKWSTKLRGDERLVAYYAFDQAGGWQRRLDCSLEPPDRELDGAIVGARRVPGRWTAKSSLEFKRPGDRVRVQIPGEFESLTFACWTKIDSLDRWYNSLFLTDSYNQGEPHWQILDSGQLYFSVRPVEQGEAGPRDFKSLSPPFWNASFSGRWIHLAVVYDVESRSISHYLNGQMLSQDDVPAEQIVKTQIGAASIGNWSLPTQPGSEFAIRNLNGSIDEFAIFAAALTADEIQEMYDNGKP